MNWRQRRDNTNVRLLLALAEELGVSVQACLQQTGLQDQPIEQVQSLELWQELAVIRNLVAHHPAPGSGLLLGQRYHLTSLGLLGYTMLASRTLREAIDITQQFRPLALSICPVSLQVESAGLLMSLDASVLPEDARCLVIERGLAAWQAVYGELLQRRFRPLAVYLDMPAAAPQADYAAYFDCPIVCDTGQNAMLISWDDLNQALPQANPVTQRNCASLCQRLCEQLDDVQTPLARQVLQALMSRSGHLYTAGEVAGWLGLSERTLHRRLAAEGQPYRALDQRVRRTLAERLLRDSALGLESIAQQLGYAEAASFSRAFKRWTGLSPDQWRHAQHKLAAAALDYPLDAFSREYAGHA
ncbi:MAG: AraC family transcriptional regulator [Gammaproteobacteria bacterium HGW-Gammaproteobacteria-11]|nr:MAG: AraC family transcriptional regulator [Gammaproteobacteria bacterium HGW-Gammaproteobacteria-11]